MSLDTANTRQMTPRKSVFVHIPHSGATMVRRLLYRKYRSIGLTYPTPPLKPLEAMSDSERRHFLSHDILVGQMEVSRFLDICDPAPRFYTIMRNPIDRVISYFNHVHVHDPKYVEAPVSLLRFLDLPPRTQISNYQLRCLRNRPARDPVSPADCEQVIEMIEGGKLKVGIREMIKPSFAHLDILSGCDPIEGPRLVSQCKGGFCRASLSDIEIDAIRSKNRLDFRLYDYCVERLKDSVRRAEQAKIMA